MPQATWDWQHLVVLAALAWALAYLIRRVVRAMSATGPAGCGSCSNAGGCATGNAKPFVSIDALETPTNTSEPQAYRPHNREAG